MTKIEKQMIGAFIVCSVGLSVGVSVVIDGSTALYNEYKNNTDTYKKECFDKFKSLEYEIIANELYCKTETGFIKAD